MEAEFANRKVYLLLGENDTETFTDSCIQSIAGSTRLLKGKLYFNLVLNHYGATRLGGRFQSATVPGVGHNSYGMYGSDCGRQIIFGDTSVSCSLRTTAYTE